MKTKSDHPDDIPIETIGRLPLYLRKLNWFESRGKKWVTSRQMAESLPGIKASKLRKDISHCGDFGTQGRGYLVSRLRKALKGVLKVDTKREVALAGAGNLGRALLNYSGFERWGFKITLAFDRDPKLIGTRIRGVKILSPEDMEQSLDESKAEVGIIAVPEAEARKVARELVQSGIKGIVNFTPVLLDTPEDVAVTHVDITCSLKTLTYYCR